MLLTWKNVKTICGEIEKLKMPTEHMWNMALDAAKEAVQKVAAEASKHGD